VEANLDALRVLATLDTHYIKPRLGTDRDPRTLDALLPQAVGEHVYGNHGLRTTP